MIGSAFLKPLFISVLLLATAAAADGQCYKFSSGTAASLSVQLSNVPAPTTTPDAFGGAIYSYSSLSGLRADVTLTVGTATVSGRAGTVLAVIDSNPIASAFNLTLGLAGAGNVIGAASVALQWLGNVLPNGNLPNPIPPVSIAYMSAVVGTIPATTVYTLDSVTSCSGAPASTPPVIQSVVNGASFQTGLASGTWTTIQGTGLSATTRAWQTSDFNGNNLPTSLDKVQVLVNGRPAYLSYISPTQLNFLTPDDTVVGPAQVQVVNSSGSSSISTITKQATAPAFFAFSQQNGRYAIAQDGSTYAFLAPANLLGTSVPTKPAVPGETTILYATGLGPTNPAYPAGQLISGALPLATNPQVLIGNIPSTVLYAGLIVPGLYQLNVVVPNLTDGDAPVAIMDGAQSPAGVYLAIQNH